MTRFKICGLRETGHAMASARAGASFLGFAFVPEVRRQLTVEQAESVIEGYRRAVGRGGPRLVGLFANQPEDEVNAVVRRCGLDLAQLCGDEPSDYWSRIDADVIRQIKVRDAGSHEATITRTRRAVEEALDAGAMALLDTYEAGALGGTGKSFDWSVAQAIAEEHDVIVAGGLTPSNVREAIATVHPWGVDVSTGVETGGAKDIAKVSAFAEAVRSADRRSGESPGARTASE